MKKWIYLAALTLPMRPATAQAPPAASAATQSPPAATGTTLKDMLSGGAHPLTIKLKDMKPEEWRRFSMAGQTGGDMTSYIALIFGAMGGGGADQMPNTEPVYYTQGQTVTLGAETYLVAYRPLLKQPDMMTLMLQGQGNANQQPPPEQMIPEKMTMDTLISLSLVNVKKISGMSDIRPFDAAKEVAENEAAGKVMLAMLQANAAQNGPGAAMGVETAKPLVAPKIRAAIAADKTLKADGNAIEVEEAENAITLRGVVVSAEVKKHAEAVVKKYLKDNGIAFTVDNELSAPEAASAKPKSSKPIPKATRKKSEAGKG